HASSVSARPSEAGDEPGRHRIESDYEDNRDRGGRRLSRQRRWRRIGQDEGHGTTGEPGSHRPEALIAASCPEKLECNIPSFIETNLAESSAECGHLSVRLSLGNRAKKADHRHRRLLRAGRERPSGCRAAEKRDELAAFHSITSSARASS